MGEFKKIWEPLRRSKLQFKTEKETWVNSEYTVFVNDATMDIEEGQIPMVWLSIKRNDQSALLDWRDLQFIKNQLIGENCEAVQIFPKESKLIDTANQFHLWGWKDSKFTLPFGWNEGRQVTQYPMKGAKQRAYPKNMQP